MGGDGVPVTLAGLRELICQETAGLRDEVVAARAEATELKAKLAESDAVIAEQARRLELARASAAKTKAVVKQYVKYGSDGEGKGNPWPKRSLNDGDLTKPHNFDVSENPTYKLLTVKHRGHKFEWRTLACLGSYLHDLHLATKPLFALLRETDDALEEEKADNLLWASELENSFEDVSDLLACRFRLLTEYVQPDVDAARIEELERRLYPREGVETPASSVDGWNANFEERVTLAYDKKLATKVAENRFTRLGRDPDAPPKPPFKPGAPPRPRGAFAKK